MDSLSCYSDVTVDDTGKYLSPSTNESYFSKNNLGKIIRAKKKIMLTLCCTSVHISTKTHQVLLVSDFCMMMYKLNNGQKGILTKMYLSKQPF